MAKKKARIAKSAIRSDPQWVKVTDSQKRKIAKNLDYRLMATHLGTVSKRQVPWSDIKRIYTRLWPIVSPQSFRHYVVPGYMAVPDIDLSIEQWREDKTLLDGEAPRMYVVESYNYQRLEKDDAPEDVSTLAAPVVPWEREREIGLFLAMAVDETTKPYIKPVIREIDPDYDPLDEDEAPKPGLRSEYMVETLADMFGYVGTVEDEKAIVTQVDTKEYQILIPAMAIEAYNAVLAKSLKGKKKLTGSEVREKAMEILAKYSVLCYPTFCAILGEDQVTIAMFRRLCQQHGYHRTGTVGKTAIFRPWSDMYPEGVPDYVLGKIEDAGAVPA